MTTSPFPRPSRWTGAWPTLAATALTTLALADATHALGRLVEILHP